MGLFKYAVILGVASALFGCTHGSVLPDGHSRVVSAVDESDDQLHLEQLHLDPALMFQVLQGEMLLERGQVLSAYDVFYRLAKDTEHPALAERAFHISMKTFSVERIQQSADLWRTISPEVSMPWRVGYLMALRSEQLELALSLWADYRQRSEVSLSEDLKNAAAQAVQSTPVEVGLAFFETLQQRYPQEWAAGYAYGYVADQYGQAELAIAILEQLINRLEAPSEVYFALANLYIENDLSVRGIDVLQPYVTSHPTDWSMQERFARLEVKAGMYAQAQTRYQSIVAENPKAFTSKLSLALLLMEAGDYDQAGDLFEGLVQVEGYQDVSHYYLGVMAQSQGHNQQAVSHLELVKHPNYHVDAKLLIAQIQLIEQGIDSAMAYLDQIEIDQDETQAKIWRAKGIFYRQAGRLLESAESYRQAMGLTQDRLSIGYSLGMVLYEIRAYQEYEQLMRSLVSEFPDEADALNALGYFYVEQNRNLDEAEFLLDRAMKLAPGRQHIIDSRGWLAYQKGQYDLAERYLEQAWSIQPDDEVLIHLIKAKWALKKFEAAQQLWQQYHGLFPNNLMLQNLMLELKR